MNQKVNLETLADEISLLSQYPQFSESLIDVQRSIYLLHAIT